MIVSIHQPHSPFALAQSPRVASGAPIATFIVIAFSCSVTRYMQFFRIEIHCQKHPRITMITIPIFAPRPGEDCVRPTWQHTPLVSSLLPSFFICVSFPVLLFLFFLCLFGFRARTAIKAPVSAVRQPSQSSLSLSRISWSPSLPGPRPAMSDLNVSTRQFVLSTVRACGSTLDRPFLAEVQHAIHTAG